MIVQLMEDLPSMALLFIVGATGYASSRWLKKSFSARAQQAKKIASFKEDVVPTDDSELDMKPTVAPSEPAAPSKQARRRRKVKEQKTEDPCPVEAVEEPIVEPTAAPEEVPPPADEPPVVEAEEAQAEVEEVQQQEQPEPVATEPVASEPVMSERVARLLSKKAARKARKAMERTLELEAAANAVQEEVEELLPEASTEASDGTSKSQTEENSEKEEELPVVEQVPAKPAEEIVREEPAPIVPEVAPAPVPEPVEEIVRPIPRALSLQESWADGPVEEWGWDSDSDSDEEDDCLLQEQQEQREQQKAYDGWSSSWGEAVPQQRWGSNSWSKQSWKSNRNQDADWWMTPFDDLIGGASFNRPHSPAPPPPPAPESSLVCIWGRQEEDMLTDGSKYYRPVASPHGPPLFTDGKQLFAAVFVSSPDGKEGPTSAPSPPAFDPYNPMTLLDKDAATTNAFGMFDDDDFDSDDDDE